MFFFFLGNNHTRSYCWITEICLIIIPPTGKSGQLFRGTHFFEAKSWSIWLVSITNINSFLFVGWPPACQVFEFTIQVMLSIAVDKGMWQTRLNLLAGPTVLRCFISVLKQLHANFAILLEMTEIFMWQAATRVLFRSKRENPGNEVASGQEQHKTNVKETL